MAKYCILREFPPELWADTGVDFTGLMGKMLEHELWKKCITPVEGAQPEISFSTDMLRPGWGAGRAVVEVEGGPPGE